MPQCADSRKRRPSTLARPTTPQPIPQGLCHTVEPYARGGHEGGRPRGRPRFRATSGGHAQGTSQGKVTREKGHARDTRKARGERPYERTHTKHLTIDIAFVRNISLSLLRLRREETGVDCRRRLRGGAAAGSIAGVHARSHLRHGHLPRLLARVHPRVALLHRRLLPPASVILHVSEIPIHAGQTPLAGVKGRIARRNRRKLTAEALSPAAGLAAACLRLSSVAADPDRRALRRAASLDCQAAAAACAARPAAARGT